MLCAMSEVEWTNDSVVQLVEEYRKLPELWDRAHDLHSVQTAKYEAWTSLARIFGCDIDLRKKITSVLASYRREKGKVKKGVRSNWFLYPHLKFLSGYLKSPHYVPKKTPEQRPEPTQQMYTMESEDMDREDDYNQEIIIKEEPMVELPPPARTATFPSQKHSRRLTRLKRSIPVQRETNTHTDSKLLEMLRLLKKSDISKKKDECDSFGEYIATSLRKHDDRTQSMIKQAINNILFEQEMKKYSHYSTEISPENPLGNMIGDDDDIEDMQHRDE